MKIVISSNTSKPIYEQITVQIKSMIMNGYLQAGDAIPSMRTLAKTLRVSVTTVKKSYEDLQRDGFIETTVGRGSFVSVINKDLVKEEQNKAMEDYIVKFIEIAKLNGESLEDIIDLVKAIYMEV